MTSSREVPGSTTEAQTAARRRALETRRKAGTSWFYWVAALSAINSGVRLMGGHWGFLFGLGITQVIDAVALGDVPEEGATLPVGAFLLDILVAAAVALVGYFAQKGHSSAYVAGIGFYGLDALLFGFAGDYLGLFIHVFALWGMWRGFSAHRELRAMERPDRWQAPSTGSAA